MSRLNVDTDTNDHSLADETVKHQYSINNCYLYAKAKLQFCTKERSLTISSVASLQSVSPSHNHLLGRQVFPLSHAYSDLLHVVSATVVEIIVRCCGGRDVGDTKGMLQC